MTIRAATAKVAVPARAARLLQLFRGSDASEGEPLLANTWARSATIAMLRVIGFPGGYFKGDFLDGASFAFQHLAASTQQHGSPRDSGVEAKLYRHLVDEAKHVVDEGFEVQWTVEDVTAAELGAMSIVYGARRSRALEPGSFRTAYGGHTLVLRGERRQPSATECLASQRYGATLCTEALLQVRQTVILRRRGEVLAGHFDEAAWHNVRFEAELDGVAPPEGMESAPWGLSFDEDRGWAISDLNLALGGNCPAASLPQVE